MPAWLVRGAGNNAVDIYAIRWMREIFIEGEKVHIKEPGDAINKDRVCPEDRKEQD